MKSLTKYEIVEIINDLEHDLHMSNDSNEIITLTKQLESYQKILDKIDPIY